MKTRSPIQQLQVALTDAVKVGLLFAVYIGTARFGLLLGPVSRFATTVWPPTGIALVALYVFGCRLWPGIALAAFVVNVLAGAPPLVAAAMAAGNTLEALLGARLLQHVPGFRPSLDRISSVLELVLFTAGLSTLLSASAGVASGWLGAPFPPAIWVEPGLHGGSATWSATWW